MFNKKILPLITLIFFSNALNTESPEATTIANVMMDSKPLTKKNSAQKISSPNENEEANIYLNFEDAALQSVLDYLAEQKKINVLPHKDMAETKVSLTTRKALTLNDAWNVLLTLLEMNGFTINQVGKLYRVVPNTENGSEPLPIYSSKNGIEPEDLPHSDQVVRYVYFFKNMKAEVAQNILSSMLEGDQSLQINEDLQACIIKDKCFNIKAAMKIIKELDTGGLREAIKIIQLDHADADDVSRLFEEILEKDKERSLRFVSAGGSKEKQYFSSDTKIFPYTAKNALILLGTEKNLIRIHNFITDKIDVPIGLAQSRLNIKELRYARAESIKPILENIIKPPSGQGSEKSSVVGKYKFFEDVIIAAEPEGEEGSRGSGNRLIISCNNDDWIRLNKFIDKLDKPQPQIAFEVMIIDVVEDFNKDLGAQMQSPENIGMGLNSFETKHLSAARIDKVTTDEEGKKTTEKVSASRLIELAQNNLTGVNSPSFITIGNPGSPKIGADGKAIEGEFENVNLWAIIRSVYKVTQTNIINQPYIVTNNFKPCNIEISETRRVAGPLESQRGEVKVATKVNKDAGTVLKLTPKVNSDGVVALDLVLDISSFGAAVDATAEPSIIRREIQTKLTMLAGEVLVIGGLKRTNETITVNKTPILGDIPIIGNLFKSKTKTKETQNLYAFIRPSIVKPLFESNADEYTQLKLDYAKLQILRNDLYIEDKDPIQRWFFKPRSQTVTQRIADARNGVVKPIDDYAYGRRQPKSVDIANDPYYRSESTIQQGRMKKVIRPAKNNQHKKIHDKLKKRNEELRTT